MKRRSAPSRRRSRRISAHLCMRLSPRGRLAARPTWPTRSSFACAGASAGESPSSCSFLLLARLSKAAAERRSRRRLSAAARLASAAAKAKALPPLGGGGAICGSFGAGCARRPLGTNSGA
eukprot:scaffold1070_cov245-Pinguiococcus_pyrenoidosus.AAC.45